MFGAFSTEEEDAFMEDGVYKDVSSSDWEAPLLIGLSEDELRETLRTLSHADDASVVARAYEAMRGGGTADK